MTEKDLEHCNRVIAGAWRDDPDCVQQLRRWVGTGAPGTAPRVFHAIAGRVVVPCNSGSPLPNFSKLRYTSLRLLALGLLRSRSAPSGPTRSRSGATTCWTVSSNRIASPNVRARWLPSATELRSTAQYFRPRCWPSCSSTSKSRLLMPI
jgi:hypothetical protein